MTNICMFMGSQSPNPYHVEQSTLLARDLAEAGYGLVWGGQASGIMGKVGDTFAQFKTNSADMIGITTTQIRAFCPNMHPDCTVVHTAADERERHKLYSQNADAYVLLPGGLGSVAEGVSILEQAYVDMHQHIRGGKPYTVKPFIFFNVGGYYNDILRQFGEMMGDYNDRNTYMGKKVANLYIPNQTGTEIESSQVVRYLNAVKNNPMVIKPDIK
jgi:predicted Rossmann-fold nucleotide-binding protein